MNASDDSVKETQSGADPAPMETEIAASYVQERAGDVMERAIAGERLLVTRYGNPRVVILSAKDYGKLRALEIAASGASAAESPSSDESCWPPPPRERPPRPPAPLGPMPPDGRVAMPGRD